ncbi:caspase-8-like [Saccoglossus kowalevskii]
MTTSTCNRRLIELYTNIESSLSHKEVKAIKLTLSDEELPKQEKANLDGAAEIFARLEEMGRIQANDLSLLRYLLTRINRKPLIDKYIKPFENDLAEERRKGKNVVPTKMEENCSTDKEEEFGKMLFDISKEICEDELISMKRLCGAVYRLIPKGDLEKMKQAHDVFQFLREDTKISSDNTELLERLLEQIHRSNLIYGSEPIHCERCGWAKLSLVDVAVE